MQLLFDLSKEHLTLPKQEIIAVLESYNLSYEIIIDTHDVLVVTLDANKKIVNTLAKRISYTYSISEFLFSATTNPTDIIQQSQQHEIKQQGTIAIRYRNRSKTQKSQKIIQILASIFTNKNKVDLKKPDVEIYVIINDDRIFVGKLLRYIDRKQYDKRKVQYRTFFSPVSLHPKLARALVNLAHVTKKSIVYDPFCGTGGILIEAGLIGCKIYGSDIQQKMINGTKKNLLLYNLPTHYLFQSDIGEIHQHITLNIDAVITDAPYGKSTTTNNEELNKLYIRSFEKISTILKPNGYIVIGLPEKSFNHMFKKYFQLKMMITIPVHRSLTRYFFVGSKKIP